MTWILTIVLSSGLAIPVADFATERECLKAETLWTLEPGVEIRCFPSEAPKPRKRR